MCTWVVAWLFVKLKKLGVEDWFAILLFACMLVAMLCDVGIVLSLIGFIKWLVS